jgi:putative Ca2+/H+ antiporter (TMEM165/GDT1 family)
VSISVIAMVFGLVAVAELPDKTLMGSRARPVLVWLGASAAFALHVTLAVVAGRLLELLPHRTLDIIVTVLFLAGAAYLLFVPERAEEEKGERQAKAEAPGAAFKVVAAAFGVILLGEFGDLTQLLTVSLVGRTHQPLSVFVGALLALVAAAALGAFGGRALLRYIPLAVIRRVGGLILVGFAGYSIYSLVR